MTSIQCKEVGRKHKSSSLFWTEEQIVVMAADLVLDTAIRDWVLIPLSVVMVLIGILRYFVSKLMRSSQVPDPKIVKEGQVIVRARNLRAAANFIPPKSFRSRRVYFSKMRKMDYCLSPRGRLKTLKLKCSLTHGHGYDEEKPLYDYTSAKIPFPLTQRFRSMLQNGIDLSTVDVSYVSSRSWYFLNLFGLRGLVSLILGEENATDDTQRMMQMSGFGFDPSKLGLPDSYRFVLMCMRSLGAEKDGLDIVQHEWALPKFEHRAEAVLKKLIRLRLKKNLHHNFLCLCPLTQFPLGLTRAVNETRQIASYSRSIRSRFDKYSNRMDSTRVLNESKRATRYSTRKARMSASYLLESPGTNNYTINLPTSDMNEGYEVREALRAQMEVQNLLGCLLIILFGSVEVIKTDNLDVGNKMLRNYSVDPLGFYSAQSAEVVNACGQEEDMPTGLLFQRVDGSTESCLTSQESPGGLTMEGSLVGGKKKMLNLEGTT
ncbi:hypothetical protein F3Y22_tig00110163pilonHSYRG00299 [Hibiscus syriacus]|uniref:ER membrane protein complex subunit 3 n=1 Tax=Hibiscus syriacus TaxID=106335 RepID=A0A6A3BG42_HIBSY|nr:hypothetical protein F3Y22_tig00110163pilonHSYRG00299 [Hibiscus syriacus]